MEFHSTEEMKSHPQRCDRMKNARSIGQVNLNDFNDDVHLTQKDTYSKPRQKRKKAQPKIGEILWIHSVDYDWNFSSAEKT